MKIELSNQPTLKDHKNRANGSNVYGILLDDAVAKQRSILRVNPKRDPLKPCVYVENPGGYPEYFRRVGPGRYTL
jgi:hypothetical protein